jgi:uncharacterized protein YlxW (UPF0749 family)
LADLNRQLEAQRESFVEQKKELQRESQMKLDELTVRYEQQTRDYRNEIEKLQATLHFYSSEEQKRHQSLRREIEVCFCHMCLYVLDSSQTLFDCRN